MGTCDFRVGGRIFATLREADGRAVVKLSAGDQQLFIEMNPDALAPVPGSWGQKGWIRIDLTIADADLIARLLDRAWSEVAPARLKKGR